MFGGLLALLIVLQGAHAARFLDLTSVILDEILVVRTPASNDCCRTHGGCRKSELTIVFDGIPVMEPSNALTLDLPGLRSEVRRSVTPWLVVAPVPDSFARERMMDGDWIEGRPRLH